MNEEKKTNKFEHPLQVSLVIPAYNEAARLSRVLAPAEASQLFAEIVVVDDGSSDKTHRVAQSFSSVHVIRHKERHGKGAAIQSGLKSLNPGNAVCFLDADLVGLNRDHITALLGPVISDDVDMAVGVIDEPEEPYRVALDPTFSGQRVLSRSLVQGLPDLSSYGFGVELCIAHKSQVMGMETRFVRLEGLNHVWKGQKRGLLRAGVSNLHMYAEIAGVWLSGMSGSIASSLGING